MSHFYICRMVFLLVNWPQKKEADSESESAASLSIMWIPRSSPHPPPAHRHCHRLPPSAQHQALHIARPAPRYPAATTKAVVRDHAHKTQPSPMWLLCSSSTTIRAAARKNAPLAPPAVLRSSSTTHRAACPTTRPHGSRHRGRST